jgi:hypothetical protein
MAPDGLLVTVMPLGIFEDPKTAPLAGLGALLSRSAAAAEIACRNPMIGTAPCGTVTCGGPVLIGTGAGGAGSDGPTPMAGVGTGLAASVADCVVEADAVDQRSDGVTSARAKKHAADKINPRFLMTPPKSTTIAFGAPIQRPFTAELLDVP